MANAGSVALEVGIEGGGSHIGDVQLLVDISGIAIQGSVGAGDVEVLVDSVVGYCGAYGDLIIYDESYVSGAGRVSTFGSGNVSALLLVEGEGKSGFVGNGDVDIGVSIALTASWSVTSAGSVELGIKVSSVGKGSGIYDDLVLRYQRRG